MPRSVAAFSELVKELYTLQFRKDGKQVKDSVHKESISYNTNYAYHISMAEKHDLTE